MDDPVDDPNKADPALVPSGEPATAAESAETGGEGHPVPENFAEGPTGPTSDVRNEQFRIVPPGQAEAPAPEPEGSRHVVLTKASKHGRVGTLISLPLTLVDEMVKAGKARFATRKDFKL
jgi:hypothetical protein